MHEPSNDRLIASARAGDEESCRILIDRLYPTVIAIVRKHLPRRDEEEDLAQEIFMKFFAKLDGYAGKQPIEHWTSRIALNTCYDRLRRQKVRPVHNFAELDLDESEFLEHALAGSADDARLAADPELASGLLEKLLATLNPRERLVIRMLDLEEKSVKEACNLTGWGASKVKVTASRARRKLRHALAELESGIDSKPKR